MAEQKRGITPGLQTNTGSFRASERADADVVLGDANGSFFYPPAFATAGEVIGFWSSVEIPDEVLARMDRLFADKSTRAANLEVSHAHAWENNYGVLWEAEHPHPGEQAAAAGWVQAREAEKRRFQDWLRATAAALPDRLDRRDVRPLTRALAIYYAARDELPVEEFRKVLSHKVSFTTGEEPVREAVIGRCVGPSFEYILQPAAYPLDPDQSKDEVRKVVEEVVGKAITEQNEAMDRVFDELDDHIITVGEDVVKMLGRR